MTQYWHSGRRPRTHRPSKFGAVRGELAGLTQEQLSFRADLSRPYVSQLERDLKSPTVDTLFRICDALDVSPAGYYAWRDRPASARQQEQDALLVQIRAIHAEFKARYGSPRARLLRQHRGQPHA